MRGSLAYPSTVNQMYEMVAKKYSKSGWHDFITEEYSILVDSSKK